MNPGRALRAALEELAGGRLNDRTVPEPTTYEGVSTLYGGSTSEMAVAISGSTDKKSREYRTAIREVQRYRKGESKPWETGRPAPAWSRLRAAARARYKKVVPTRLAALLRQIDQLGVTVVHFGGEVIMSTDARYRGIDNVYIAPATLRQFNFFPAARARQWGPAGMAFYGAYFKSYGLPGAVTDDVEQLTLALG